MLQAITERTTILLGASKLAVVEVRKVLRRLHVANDQQSRKEGMRPFARIAGKVALIGPFSVASAFIAQVRLFFYLRIYFCLLDVEVEHSDQML